MSAGLLGEMMSGAFNTIGFSWIGSPAATELETVRWMILQAVRRVRLHELLELLQSRVARLAKPSCEHHGKVHLLWGWLVRLL